MIITPYRTALAAEPARRTLPPLPIYVNTISGTAGGDGTASRPLNSLAAAVALCSGLPDWVVRVTAPEAAPVRQQIDLETSMDLVIEGVRNEPWHITGSERLTGAWLQSGSVWFRAFSATLVGTVVVTTMTEQVGNRDDFYLKLRENTATPATPGLGEYGYAGGILYIRLPDDGNPAAHTFEVSRRNTCLTTTGAGMLTVRDVDARYTIVTPILNGTTGKPAGTGRLTVEDSFVGYSSGTGNGVTGTGQNVETICTRVTAQRVGNDGFNLHATAGLTPVMTLNGCNGSYNGDKAGTSAQGASNHETTRLIINGGRFDYNVSGGMVVIDSATCDIHGDTAYGQVAMVGNMRLGNTAGTIAGQAAAAWLNNSHGTVTGPVNVTESKGVGVRVATAGAVPGAASINSYNNALPDLIA